MVVGGWVFDDATLREAVEVMMKPYYSHNFFLFIGIIFHFIKINKRISAGEWKKAVVF